MKTQKTYTPWVNIDLHTHTRVGITRDGTSDVVSFDYSTFVDVLQRHAIRLMACTNHNLIDFAQYIALRYLARLNGCNYLLGVELDTETPKARKPLHVAMIVDSTDAYRDFLLSRQIGEATRKKKEGAPSGTTGRIVFSSEEIVNYIKDNKVVLVPHGDKDKGLLNRPTKEELEEALQLVKENFIHVLDSRMSKWKLERVKACLDDIGKKQYEKDFGGVLFSDCRDWSKYDEVYPGFSMDAEPTFNGFLHAISNPVERFAAEKDATDPTNYISYAVFDDGKKKTTLNFSPRYNCVIGKSGSGKSLFVYLLQKALMGSEMKENYLNYKYSLKLFGPRGQELQPNDIHPVSGMNIYNCVIDAIRSDDDQNIRSLIEKLADENRPFSPHAHYLSSIRSFSKAITQYVSLYKRKERAITEAKTQLSNFHSSAIFLANAKASEGLEVSGPEPVLTSFPNSVDYKKVSSSFDSLKTELENYDGPKKEWARRVLNVFERMLELIKADDSRRKAKALLDRAKRKAVHDALATVNGSIGETAKAVSKIRHEMVEQKEVVVRQLIYIYKTNRELQSLNLALDTKPFLTAKTTIASGVDVVEKVVDPTQITAYDQRNQHGFFKIRGHSTSIRSESRNLTKNAEVIDMLNDLIRAGVFGTLEETGEVEIDSGYVSIQTNILFNGQDVTQLNPGDMAKKYIDLYFKNRVMGKPNSVIIFDQIENDVDKPFLEEVIVKRIWECYRQSQVFIVTHDPIIAVNADPRRYILAEKSNRKQISYRSFAPESEERDELDTIAKCVDGSKDVIRHRFEIYEKENAR